MIHPFKCCDNPEFNHIWINNLYYGERHGFKCGYCDTILGTGKTEDEAIAVHNQRAKQLEFMQNADIDIQVELDSGTHQLSATVTFDTLEAAEEAKAYLLNNQEDDEDVEKI